MTNPTHPDLLAEIERYCSQHSLSRSAFGIMAMNDPRFVSDLEKGRELRRATIAKVRASMVLSPSADRPSAEAS